MFLRFLIPLGGAVLALSQGAQAAPYDITEKSVVEIAADLKSGRVTSVELVKLYEARIESLNPALHAVIAINPEAITQAAASDLKRKQRTKLGPLAGVPILIKDNIESADPIATTAGSLALAGNITLRDAPLVARLRAAGAIILGKTNLSEWANIRSSNSISGWSAVGGQARNPYAYDRNTCGSSAGSGAAGAASLAAATVGTETDGSVTCPSAVNGLVGLKPTVGLVSRTRVVPISHSQDTAGPMTRSVMDAALLLDAMAGTDSADAATARADKLGHQFAAGLRSDALKGIRVGVMRFAAGFHPETEAVFKQALALLQAAGAILVDIKKFPNEVAIGADEHLILMTELKTDLNAYLSTTSAAQVPTRTLADLIAFDKSRATEELALFGQEEFEAAEATKGLTDPAYLNAVADAHRAAGSEGIDKMLRDNNVSVLVAPTMGPAWLIDPILKDKFTGGGAGGPAAVAGYPHLSVPMGLVDGLPVGLSFIGTAWNNAAILSYGFAYEQASHARRAPRYLQTSEISNKAVLHARK